MKYRIRRTSAGVIIYPEKGIYPKAIMYRSDHTIYYLSPMNERRAKDIGLKHMNQSIDNRLRKE